jgi:hypothetical protein
MSYRVSVVYFCLLSLGFGCKSGPQPVYDKAFHEAVAVGDLGRVSEGARAVPGLVRGTSDTIGGRTPLHVAAALGHTAVAEFLLREGADVDARLTDSADLPGATPLHLAAAAGHRDAAELLLGRGADPNAILPGGAGGVAQAAPLHLASHGGHQELVEMLLAKGGDGSLKDAQGRTYRECQFVSPEDRLIRHMDRMVSILEDNKEDPDRAAERLRDYVAANKTDFASVKRALEEKERAMSEVEREAKSEEVMKKLGPTMDRALELMSDEYKLAGHSGVQEAMSALFSD